MRTRKRAPGKRQRSPPYLWPLVNSLHNGCQSMTTTFLFCELWSSLCVAEGWRAEKEVFYQREGGEGLALTHGQLGQQHEWQRLWQQARQKQLWQQTGQQQLWQRTEQQLCPHYLWFTVTLDRQGEILPEVNFFFLLKIIIHFLCAPFITYFVAYLKKFRIKAILAGTCYIS